MTTLGIMTQINSPQNSDAQHIESQSNHTRCNTTQYWVLCHIFIDMLSTIWSTVVVPNPKKFANIFIHIFIKINDAQHNYTQPNYTWNNSTQYKVLLGLGPFLYCHILYWYTECHLVDCDKL